MKKNSLLGSLGARFFAFLILSFAIISFLWLFGNLTGLKSGLRDMLRPLFRASEAVSGFFGRDQEIIENENKNLEARNSILEARVRELEALLNFPQERTAEGKVALVASQAPQTPFGTLIVDYENNSGVSPGTKVLGYGGIYLGRILEVGEKLAIVELISYPGLETEAWLEKQGINITLKGQGGQNMRFYLPKSIKVDIGDKIVSNTNPQYLMGQVEFIEERPAEPLQDILLRIPLNFRSLRYVQLVN